MLGFVSGALSVAARAPLSVSFEHAVVAQGGSASGRRRCHFPFQYNGKVYETCLRYNDEAAFWCPLTPEFNQTDPKHSAYGFCVVKQEIEFRVKNGRMQARGRMEPDFRQAGNPLVMQRGFTYALSVTLLEVGGRGLRVMTEAGRVLGLPDGLRGEKGPYAQDGGTLFLTPGAKTPETLLVTVGTAEQAVISVVSYEPPAHSAAVTAEVTIPGTGYPQGSEARPCATEWVFMGTTYSGCACPEAVARCAALRAAEDMLGGATNARATPLGRPGVGGVPAFPDGVLAAEEALLLLSGAGGPPGEGDRAIAVPILSVLIVLGAAGVGAAAWRLRRSHPTRVEVLTNGEYDWDLASSILAGERPPTVRQAFAEVPVNGDGDGAGSGFRSRPGVVARRIMVQGETAL